MPNTFTPIGFDVNYNSTEQSVFTVVENDWAIWFGWDQVMITEDGIIMATETGNNVMITENKLNV